MTKVVYKNGEDLGKPYWRIYCKKSGGVVSVVTENFENGFYDGEKFDKISARRGSNPCTEHSSVITKDWSKLESYRPLVIEEFRKILKTNIVHYRGTIEIYQGYINMLEDSLVCDIFKDIIRDEKLKDIGI